jgi:hypothetical protein
MRRWMVLGLFATGAFGQALVEYTTATAAGSVGAASTARSAGSSIGSVFDQLNRLTGQAAPASRPAPSAPTRSRSRRRATAKAVADSRPIATPHTVVRVPVPPAVTAEDLKKVAVGMNRDQLLEIVKPSARISVSKNGRLVETFTFMAKGDTVGTVRLTDGAVSSVQIH